MLSFSVIKERDIVLRSIVEIIVILFRENMRLKITFLVYVFVFWGEFKGLLAKPSDCQVSRIPQCSLKNQTVHEFFNIFKSRYEKKINYEAIPVGSIVPSNKTLFLFCEDRLQGTDHKLAAVQCCKGTWILDSVCPRETICPVFSPDIEIHITYSEGIKMGSVATFSCSKNSKLIGEKTATCQNDGRWSSPLPRCQEITCLPFSSGSGINIMYTNSNKIGSVAIFSCFDLHKVIGESFATCQHDGLWSSLPRCESDCQVPRILHGSLKDKILGNEFNFKTLRYEKRMTYKTVTAGTTVHSNKTLDLFCQDGFTFRGSVLPVNQWIKCFRGKWIPDPVCLQRRELRPTTVQPSLSSPTTTPLHLVTTSRRCSGPNETISSKAFSSSTLPPTVSNAIANEKVTTTVAITVATENIEGASRCRLNIKPSSHLQVHPLKDSYRFGETVALSCPYGEEMTNDVERLMCLGERWSDVFPDCIQS